MALPLTIGCGAGFAHDRPDAGRKVADYLAARGGGYLIYETLSERTVALAQMAKGGRYGRLGEFLRQSLPSCLRSGIKIIGNFGAAAPLRAAAAVAKLARELGLRAPRIGAVCGDNLLSRNRIPEWLGEYLPAKNGDSRSVISANAYIGAEGIVKALRRGADIVVAGRVADPSLALAAVIYERDLNGDDWQGRALGTLAGHLLECGAQVSGGYFADPGMNKNVPDLDSVGFPIAEIDSRDSRVVITKPPGTGGLVSERTVKEQLLYEIHDPKKYPTPDVTLDIAAAVVAEEKPGRVGVCGVRGGPPPEKLRLQICRRDGWIGESEISYYGQTAPSRAAAACEVLRRRMRALFPEMRHCLDIIGICSAANDGEGVFLRRRLREAEKNGGEHRDVRVRFAARGDDLRRLERALWEVEALYTNGPAGGGGVRSRIAPCIFNEIVFVPRGRIKVSVRILQ